MSKTQDNSQGLSMQPPYKLGAIILHLLVFSLP